MRKLLAFLLSLAIILCPILSAPALALEDNLPFDDVSDNHWARGAIAWAHEQGLTSGTGPRTFSPQKTITRAMFYMMLYSLEGRPAPVEEIELRYRDVPPNAYYRDALQWAASTGMIDWRGVNFYPNEPIVREDLAEALFSYENHYRTTYYPELPEWTLAEPAPFPSQYTDVDRDPDHCWAMRIIVSYGIMAGRTSTTLAPRGSSTRAEAVFMIWKMYHYLQDVYSKYDTPEGER